jgi:ribosomal protein S18 acetylase RimI-like enzyme
MYDSLSETSKRYFHPEFLGFDLINMYWFVLQILLCLSTIRSFGRLFARIFRQSILFPMVAVSKTRKEIVGFAYLIPRGRVYGKQRMAGLSIVVRDDFQGAGIGSMLVRSLLAKSAKENIRRLSLTVLPENAAAIRLYEKYGFRQVRLIKERHRWRGRRYDAVQMELNLPTENRNKQYALNVLSHGRLTPS